MAGFLASPLFSLATIPIPLQRTFSINGGLLYFGLKRVQTIQFSRKANISSARSKCFRTTISCSAKTDSLEIVQNTIAKQLSIDVCAVTPDTKFADSLDTVEIMMALEEQFGVTIGEGGAENIVTIQDAADLILKLQGASA